MSSQVHPVEKDRSKKRFLLGLLAAVFAVNVIDVFVPLMLPEIAQTYNITRSAAASLTAFSLLAGVGAGFALSAISIRVRYKTLLLAGALCVPICVAGIYFAPSFWIAQLFYALNGVGSAIVLVMSTTLVAELYPLNKKALRISWLSATGFLALLVANPITGFISNSGITSWLNSLVWFLLPASAVCFLMVVFFVPSQPRAAQSVGGKAPFLNGYKEILTNRSALGCLSNAFFGGTWMAVTTFSMAFLADVFGVSPAFRGMVGLLTASVVVAGILISGFLVNPFGRKRLFLFGSVVAIVVSVITTVMSIFVKNLWLVIGLRTVSNFTGGFVFVALPALVLEQVPKYRATLMSLGQGLSGIGRSIGILVGGAILVAIDGAVLGYSAMWVGLGVMGLMGSTSIFLFVKDPCKGSPKIPEHLTQETNS